MIEEEESHDLPQNKKSSDSLHNSSESRGSGSDQSGRGSGKGSSGSLKKNMEEQAMPSLSSSSGLWMKKTDSLQLHEDHYSTTPDLRRHERGVVKATRYKNSPQLGRQGVGSASHSSKPPTENFASARRGGADWRSLTEPACLPITTDYFPSDEKLSRDFFEYPSKLVASTYSYGSGEATGEKT